MISVRQSETLGHGSRALVKPFRRVLSRAAAALFALLVCLFTHSASAQNVQFTQGAVGSGLDNTIRIPVASYPGRGAASLPVTLYYSSKVWRVGYLKTVHANVNGFSIPRTVAEAAYAEHSSSGWTTSLDVPRIEWPKQNDLYWYDGKPYPNSINGTYRVAQVFVHMPDGSTHELRSQDEVYPNQGYVRQDGDFYAVDGSRMRFDNRAGSTPTLYLPDGSRYEFRPDEGKVLFIDRNGNALNYDTAVRVWTDTLGRLVGTPWPANPQAGASYSYAPPGYAAAYTFKWASLSDVLTPDAQGQTPPLKAASDFYLPQPGQEPTSQGGSNFPQASGMSSLFASASDPDSDNPDASFTNVVGRGQVAGAHFNPAVLSEVLLPNGLSYKFTYNVYGEIDRVAYPEGGYESYTYGQVASLGNVTAPYDQGSRGVTRREQGAGGAGALTSVWTYEGGGAYVKVTAPDGTVSETYRHNFRNPSARNFGYQDARNGLAYDERVRDVSGVMLRRTLTKWGQTAHGMQLTYPSQPQTVTSYTAWRNPRPEKSVSLILDTGGDALAKLITYGYDTTYEFTTGHDRTGMTESHFATVGQATAQADVNNAADPAGAYPDAMFPPACSSVTTYENGQGYRGRNLVGLVTSVALKDAAGGVVSKTETSYDEGAYPLIAYGDLGADAAYLDPGTTLRGNPTTVRRYTDVGAGGYLETHARFDQYGNPVTFWDERGIESQKEYAAAYRHAYLTQTTSAVPDPSGQYGSDSPFTSSSTYEAATGLVLTTTDANGQVTTFGYADDAGNRDPLNRPRKVTRPDGGWTKTSYNDVAGNLYIHTESQVDSVRSAHAYQFFDGLGRASRSLAREPDGKFVVAETRYDASGRVGQTSNPVRTTVSGAGGDASRAAYWETAAQPGYWTTNAYDALGRVKRVTLPDGTYVTTEYEGVYTTVTDQAGRRRRQKTDALGRVVRVDEPDAGADLGDKNSPAQPSFYEYDALGNVVRIGQGLAQAGANPEVASSYVQHRYFRYDALSRLTFEKQAEQAGTITAAADPLTGNTAWSRLLTYDETRDGVSYKGLLSKAEDARHVYAFFHYDRLGRTQRVDYSDGTPPVVSRYDQMRTDAPPSGEQPVAFYNRGRLTEVTTEATASVPQTSQLYDYDLMGRARRQRQVVGANTYELRYGYALGGGLVSERYPSGRVVNYGYDGAGRLTTVGSGSTNYASAMSYAPFGALESMTMGNGAVFSMSYGDSRLQLSSISLTQGTTVLQKYEYRYGEADMATGAVDETKNTGQVAGIESTVGAQKLWQQRFKYDSLGRLTSAGEYRGDNGEQSYRLNYDYDDFGNRQQRSTRNQNNPLAQVWVEEGSYDSATNRLTSGLTYDDAGNVTQDSRFRMRKFSYDANNRLKQSSGLDDSGATQSVYDGAGRRVATRAGGQVTQVYVYDVAGDLVAEYGGALSPNGTRYMMGDQQGSTRLVMSGGSVVARHDYLPYGEEVGAGVGMRTAAQGYGQADGERHRYAGMEADEATGLSHTPWREFDSLSARWTATDPYGGSMSLSSPQSFNRYAYCDNDPVNHVDPTGLMLSDIGIYQTDNAAVAVRLNRATIAYTRHYNEGVAARARERQQQTPNAMHEAGHLLGLGQQNPQSSEAEQRAQAESYLTPFNNADEQAMVDQSISDARAAVSVPAEGGLNPFAFILTVHFRPEGNTVTPEQAIDSLDASSGFEGLDTKQNVFDGRKSNALVKDDSGSFMPAADYFKKNSGVVAITYGDWIFVGKAFFAKDRDGRAQTMIHESVVHKAWRRSDLDFGTPRPVGSRAISDFIDTYYRRR